MLCEAAYVLNLSLRAEDSVFHLAGGRFLLLLPGLAPGALCTRAEEVRTSITALCRAGTLRSVAVRCGSALFPRDGAHRDELQRAAAFALAAAREDAAGD
jgi:GGDEF domain-containing protein